jgi:hypothetical protein
MTAMPIRFLSGLTSVVMLALAPVSSGRAAPLFVAHAPGAFFFLDPHAARVSLIHDQLRVFQASGDADDFHKVVRTLMSLGPFDGSQDKLAMVDVYGEVFSALDKSYKSSFGAHTPSKTEFFGGGVIPDRRSPEQIAADRRALAEHNRRSFLAGDDHLAVFVFAKYKKRLIEAGAWDEERVKARLEKHDLPAGRVQELLNAEQYA